MGDSTSEKIFKQSDKMVEVSGRCGNDSMYTVRWADGHSSRYPFIWLKDNCRCSKCYTSSCYQRLVLMADLDPEVKPNDEEITQNGLLLKVTWPDSHIGEYPSSWLRYHRFDKGIYDPIYDIKVKTWGSELAGKVPSFTFDGILNNDDILLEWLKTLYETGLAVLVEAPRNLGALDAIGKRVAYLRQTFYEKPAAVYPKPNESSLAYSGSELGLHTDLPFFGFSPGMQMLQCIRQTINSGGDNQFADGFYAALSLKDEHPEVYKLLTTVNIHFRNCGTDHVDEFHLIKGRPIIEEDNGGTVKQVWYNDQVRASYLNVPVEKVQDVYRAMKLFNQTLNKYCINMKLREGEVATFNNTRVLHGRSGFSVDSSISGEQVRLYGSAYMEWDELFSKMRVLREKKEGELRV